MILAALAAAVQRLIDARRAAELVVAAEGDPDPAEFDLLAACHDVACERGRLADALVVMLQSAAGFRADEVAAAVRPVVAPELDYLLGFTSDLADCVGYLSRELAATRARLDLAVQSLRRIDAGREAVAYEREREETAEPAARRGQADRPRGWGDDDGDG